MAQRHEEHRREVARLQVALAAEATKAATAAAECGRMEAHDQVAALKAQLEASQAAAQRVSSHVGSMSTALHVNS